MINGPWPQQRQTNASRSPDSMVNNSMAGKPRTTTKRGAGRRRIEGKDLRLVDEVRYIQRRAAIADARVVSLGQLILFSAQTGDAWLLDRADQLAVRPARGGDPERVDIKETDANFAIAWRGHYRIDGAAFSYLGHDSGRVTTILGYPTQKLGPRG
jgi:hypothetical protein